MLFLSFFFGGPFYLAGRERVKVEGKSFHVVFYLIFFLRMHYGVFGRLNTPYTYFANPPPPCIESTSSEVRERICFIFFLSIFFSFRVPSFLGREMLGFPLRLVCACPKGGAYTCLREECALERFSSYFWTFFWLFFHKFSPRIGKLQDVSISPPSLSLSSEEWKSSTEEGATRLFLFS